VDVDRNLSASGNVSALTLQWLMFDFGERDAVVEAARQISLASNIKFTAVHQQVIHAVTLSFYIHTSAQAHLRTATQALKNAQEVEAAAEDRQRRGIGTVIEVAQARQATAQARLAEVQATGALQNAQQSLVGAMGVSPLSKFKVADVSQRTLSRSDARSVERIVADALSRRPDVQGAYAAEKASAAAIRAAEADFKPKIFLSATSAYASGRLGLSSIPSVGGVRRRLNVSGNQWNNTSCSASVVPIYDAGCATRAGPGARRSRQGRGDLRAHPRRGGAPDRRAAQNAVETARPRTKRRRRSRRRRAPPTTPRSMPIATAWAPSPRSRSPRRSCCRRATRRPTPTTARSLRPRRSPSRPARSARRPRLSRALRPAR
jgi:outer membrane protein TolC